MEVRLTDLLKGWGLATINDLIGADGVFTDGDWVETKDQDASGNVRLIQLADIGDGFFRNKSNRFLTYEKAIQLGCNFLKPKDILIARMPDPLGRACIFPGDPKPCVTAVDVCIVRPSPRIADNNWLMYFINSISFRSEIESLQSGSTRKRISRSNLAKLLLPLPPFPEQHRIVAKIEELFTKLDAGIEALKKVKAQLKRYRQAVLKYAFEGKLTQEWREANKDKLEPASVLLESMKEERKKKGGGKFKEFPPLDTAALPELPERWVWTKLGVCSDLITKGESPNWQGFSYVDEGVPFIRSENVLWRSINFTDIAKIPEEFHKKLRRSQIRANDVLINLVGASIGRCCLVPINIKEANINQAVALIRVKESLRSTYLMNLLLSPNMQRVIHGSKVETARPNISLEDLNQLVIPLSPPKEQEKIVEEIENRLSVADELEKVFEQSLKKSDRLRQSILKTAFEGKLVPQDPTDEPAEKLLRRIKAEKAKKELETKGRRKKSNRMELI